MKILGLIMLLSMAAALCVTYHRHMKAIWADIAEDDAERMADEKFEQMKNSMQVRVVQRLQIVDEMEGRQKK